VHVLWPQVGSAATFDAEAYRQTLAANMALQQHRRVSYMYSLPSHLLVLSSYACRGVTAQTAHCACKQVPTATVQGLNCTA
jgi:hypothetical protein